MNLELTFVLLWTLAAFTDGETCVNKQEDKNCESWKASRFCDTTSQYRTYMEENCKKSCGICVVKKDCLNSAQYAQACSLWKQIGYCDKASKYFTFMSEHCPLECGICTVTKLQVTSTCSDVGSSGDCSLWKSYGYCDAKNTYYPFMKSHCRKTCGICQEECKDHGDAAYCAKYKSYCKNAVAGEIISHNCPMTCEVCKATPTTAPIVCGKGYVLDGRVVGGVDASPGSWPWQAALKLNGALTCGGTLVAKNWVLTAGHCLISSGKLVKEEELEVVLGDHDRNKVEGTEQTFKVLRIVRNPSYNPSTKDSDIALLQLNQEATLNKYVGTACLPTEEPKTSTNSTCYITGFGKTGDEAAKAVILQQAKLPVVTNTECSILNKYPTVTENMLCAGYGLDFSHTESGCRGDSGGPFVCEKSGSWYIQGVVSWGSSRCISGENFTVFARVLKFVDWIKSTIG